MITPIQKPGGRVSHPSDPPLREAARQGANPASGCVRSAGRGDMHGQERLDAAIVGAGFAGLALACLLAEHGRAICILERRPDLRSGGAAILLQPNGLAALDRLGVLEPVLGAGSRIDRSSL